MVLLHINIYKNVMEKVKVVAVDDVNHDAEVVCE